MKIPLYVQNSIKSDVNFSVYRQLEEMGFDPNGVCHVSVRMEDGKVEHRYFGRGTYRNRKKLFGLGAIWDDKGRFWWSEEQIKSDWIQTKES